MENFVIPRLRRDLVYREFEQEDIKYTILIDPKGYCSEPVMLNSELFPVIQYLDGVRTFNDLLEFIGIDFNAPDAELLIQTLINILENLDYSGLLESDYFLELKEEIDKYKASPVRPPVCSGSSYSSDPEELKRELSEIIDSSPVYKVSPNVRGIIVPHIDFRIGTEAHKVYSGAYRAVSEDTPETVVIFGTAHFMSTGMFMLTEKDFETPLGIIETDNDLIQGLKNRLGKRLLIDDMPHRFEHSIELQLVLLQHIFKDKKIKILPVLVGTFHDFLRTNQLPEQNSEFKEFIDSLVELSADKKTLFVASADLAHIGRKFDDEFDAEPLLNDLKISDAMLIDKLGKSDYNGFFNSIAEVKDKNKICGLSPIYSIVYALKPQKVQFIEYAQWNEKETNSAVSFASLALY